MEAKTIQRYQKYSVAQLRKKAQVVFNAFIRKRDSGKPCVNCGEYRKLQAGHFYPTSTHSHLRFNEDNVHGECLHCNYFNSQSHAYGYRTEIEIRIGKKAFNNLQLLAEHRKAHKFDRYTLIEIIQKYSNK